MNIEIIQYNNPYKPGIPYYKATYGNETYHHTDEAIVKTWLTNQVMNSELNIEKQRLTEKAIDAFYKK